MMDLFLIPGLGLGPAEFDSFQDAIVLNNPGFVQDAAGTPSPEVPENYSLDDLVLRSAESIAHEISRSSSKELPASVGFRKCHTLRRVISM